jgi:hypothetical protein
VRREIHSTQRRLSSYFLSVAGGLDDDERYAALEEERAAVQAELDQLKEMMKTHAMVPRAHLANLQQFGSSKSLGGAGANGGVNASACV